MRTTIIAIIVFLQTPALADEVSDSCLGCHRGRLSLDSLTVDELEARYAEIVAAQRAHPSPLPTLDSEALRALAAALAGD